MTMTIAVQMDPIEGIDIRGDSTFVLLLEAVARGYRLFHYLPELLSLREGRLRAVGRYFTVQNKAEGRHFTWLSEPERQNLADFDVVLMRQDPPFDMAYITATHLLEQLGEGTLVVNDPFHVRNAPEKLYVTYFSQFMPPTLITRDVAEIRSFRAEHKDIIIKPLYGNGGAGVFHIPPGDENLSSLLEVFATLNREPWMIQRFIPEIRTGDKRIILIDGEAVGAVSRVPSEGEVRANLHVGARPERTTLTAREVEICAALRDPLRERGLIFVGIDVIGEFLTEINVTSPTGLQEINRLDGVMLQARIWDVIERRLER